MTHKELEDYMLQKPQTWLDYPFGSEVAVYKVGTDQKGKIFALVTEGSDPIRVSLKCDPVLAIKLREEYETVMPGYHLNKKHWNTIVASGQLTDDYIYGLVDLSYDLVAKTI